MKAAGYQEAPPRPMYLLEELPQHFLAVNGASVGKNTWVSPRPLPSTQAHLHSHRLIGKESLGTVSVPGLPQDS